MSVEQLRGRKARTAVGKVRLNTVKTTSSGAAKRTIRGACCAPPASRGLCDGRSRNQTMALGNGRPRRISAWRFKRWRRRLRFFETVGNAIVIAYDDRPVLATDPWINGDAYFGSWAHDYEIPPAQLQAIQQAQYHWFSHGHPDHLNIASLPMLTRGQFLVSDHYGNRIQRDLTAAGYEVRVLPDREWTQLSKGIRIYSVANRNQELPAADRRQRAPRHKPERFR